ncbi:hypothetical protein CTM97_06200 [Photobacterium phosphoreum]|uniref:DNA alkylation repair protein n=1 Tax=Photobacterium phosphoreum TaxID=659 RepID=A0A2T3JTP3_PHOPO|nr:DNA alkylation repair protein [Photobacterium phosphoreum]PSU25869.1 hypothetical protein CTM96_07075 [Photobacterium phosphoreum]PSU43223.1 hypothetical protein CTM97_06200 [Photobacterium phosphoreum]PSU52512.1 hypothetical protein C9J18_08135 [Photobacterium phosphoreum]
MHLWNQAVKAALEPLANADNAKMMKSYMRDRFEFYGIQSIPRRTALKPLFTKQQLPVVDSIPSIVEELWMLPEREYQLVAIDLLIKHKKRLHFTMLPVLERLLITKSWWDTVDFLASHITSALFLNYPQQTLEYITRWRQSENIWLRRTALLFQLKFKHDTDSLLLFDVIGENQANSEFFIQKAIGWALREYSKTDPIAVKKFIVEQNIQGLAKREALKWVHSHSVEC